MGIERNIQKFYLYSAFKEAVIIGPIIVLFLLFKGLKMTEIMILQSIFSFSIFLFEVPTGAIADRFGRKYSLALGGICVAFGLALYVIFNSFYIFAIAEIIFSLGLCFKSGSDSALLYDSLKILEREGEFQSIYGKGQSFVYYIQAFGSILASLLYVTNPYSPLLISIVFMLFASMISLSFKEAVIEKSEELQKESYMSMISRSIKYVFTHNKVFGVTVFALSFFIFFRTSFWFYTPYFQAVNIPEVFYGLLFFIFNMVAAFMSKRVDKFIAFTKPKSMIIINILLMTSFFIMGSINHYLAVFAILLQQMARGLYKPVLNKYVNKHTESDNRATVLSVISLLTNLAAALAMPLAGLMIDNMDVFHVHIIYGIMLFATTILLNLFLNKTLATKI